VSAPSPSRPLDRPARNRAVVSLIAAIFAISITFGLNMPLLPPLIAAVTARGEAVSIPLHAGLLAAVFTFALGAAAPVWGAWSDRVGRRPLLLIGMGGFAATLFVFAAPAGLPALYAVQLLTGAAAAAVMPVASALVADLAPDDHWRASRLAWLNMALVAGFVLGPVAGTMADRLLLRDVAGQTVLVTPFLAASVLALLVLAMLWRWAPGTPSGLPARRAGPGPQAGVRALLALTFMVSLSIGVFEVAIAIRGGRTLGLSLGQVGALFTGCSLLMFAAQAAVFSPRVQPRGTAELLAPAFVVLAMGMAVAGFATSFPLYAVAVALFAVSGGVLVPVLAYWVSRRAGGAQGRQLGRQTAAAGLGQAAGSSLAGVLFDSAAPSGAALWLGAALVLGAALFAFAKRRTLLDPAAHRA